jgi:hypothetical protein
MKWNECSCSEKHTCNCIFWNLFFFGGEGRAGEGGGFMYFVSKILWSGFPQGSSEKFAISYQIKHEKFTLKSPSPCPYPPFLVLIYWLN